jgi:mRNA interferase RelE/StbE
MKKQIKITYLKKAAKFIKKNNLKEEEIDELVIRLIKIVKFNKEINLDFKALQGELKGKYRIRKGKIRIIVSIEDDEIIIEAIIINIDFRGDVYK